MNFSNGTYCARLNEFYSSAKTVGCGTLISHLGLHVVPAGGFAHEPGFRRSVGQWLLAIYMLTHPHCPQRCGCMVMVGGTDNHGIDFVTHLIQQRTVVNVLLRVGELLCFLIEPHLVDITDGNYVAKLSGLIDIATTFAADADAGNVQLLIR
jgi:hypothetical protein